MLLGCEKNPCNDVPNVVYQYPDLPKNHTMTIEEVDKFVDLPKKIAECITTDNLIESILTYPYISLIFAGATSQSGYDLVKDNTGDYPSWNQEPTERRVYCRSINPGILLALMNPGTILKLDTTCVQVSILR